MYRNGVDIRVLKEILGHENLGTTEIYTHLSSEQLEKAAEANLSHTYVEKTKKHIKTAGNPRRFRVWINTCRPFRRPEQLPPVPEVLFYLQQAIRW